MNLPDVAYKTSTALLGVATLVLTADLVHAMTREALFGKAQSVTLPVVVAEQGTSRASKTGRERANYQELIAADAGSLSRQRLSYPISRSVYHSKTRTYAHHAGCCCLSLSQVDVSKPVLVNTVPGPAQDWIVVVRPPWLAEGQGKARRLFEADQGPSKRVISLARDQTILKLTSAEFKDRLADVLSLLPELPLSALPPKMLSKLVMMHPGNIADQLVLLRGLFQSKQDINELLLKEPTLLTIPFGETALHIKRLKGLLESPRIIGGQHPYVQVDFDDFVATHPEFLMPENVVLSLRALRPYLGRAMHQDATIKDYVTGNPGMLVKGYRHMTFAPVQHMSSGDDSFSQWWL